MDNTSKSKNIKWFVVLGIEIILFITILVVFLVSMHHNSERKKLGYDIPENNALVNYTNVDKLIGDLNEKTGKTRYLLISRPTCPWCYQYVPYINAYATKNDIDIWYFNPQDYRGATVDKDGNYTYDHIEYEKIVNFIRSTEGAFSKGFIRSNSIESTEDPNVIVKVPWLYVPTLYKVVDGTIVEKLKTVPGHDKIDGILPSMTDVQKEVLMTNIEDFFKGE